MGPKHLGVEPRQLRGRLHGCDLCTLTLSGVEVTPHSAMGLPQNIHPCCRHQGSIRPLPVSARSWTARRSTPTQASEPQAHHRTYLHRVPASQHRGSKRKASHPGRETLPINLAPQAARLVSGSVWTGGHARPKQRREPSTSCSGGPDKLWASVPAWAA